MLCIVNPRSGQTQTDLGDYLTALGSNGAEIVLRFLGDHRTLTSILEDARDFDRVVTVGGDGTVSSVCYRLRGTGVPVVAFPAGTANLTALNLKMPTNPKMLADVTLNGTVISLDMGELNCPGSETLCYSKSAYSNHSSKRHGFLVAAGAGFDARIMEAASQLKQNVGVAAYLMGALQNLTPTVARFQLRIDDNVIETDGIAVLVVNLARIQFDLAITYDSDPGDGTMEVVILRTRNAVQLLPTVWTALLERTVGHQPGQAPGLDIYSARHVLIEAEPALPLQYDGEVLASTTPLEVQVLPSAATLVVPENYSQSRR